MTTIYEVEMAKRVTGSTKGSNTESDNIRKNSRNATAVPPDGGYGWVIVFASSMCALVIYGILYGFGIFLVYFVDHYNTSKAKVSWIGSLFCGCLFFTGPVGGALINKFGFRKVTIIGSLISTSAFLLSIAATNIELLTFTYGILGGIGFGLINMAILVCVSCYFTSRRAFATGLFMCGGSVGSFAIPPMVSYLLKIYDWKGTLLILSGLALNCAVFGSLMRPLSLNGRNSRPPVHYNKHNMAIVTKIDRKHKPIPEEAIKQNLLRQTGPKVPKKSLINEAASTEANDIPSELSLILSTIQIQSEIKAASPTYIKRLRGIMSTVAKALDLAMLKETEFLIICIAYLFGMMGLSIPFMFLPHMSITKGIDREKSPFLISILAIANLLGRFVIGLIADKVKVRALDIMIVCVCISGLATFSFPLCYNYEAIASVSALYGFFVAPKISLLNVVLVDMLGLKRIANAFGLVSLFRGIGYLIGPPIAGAIFDATGSYDISFYMAGTFLLMSASLMMLISWIERRRIRLQSTEIIESSAIAEEGT